MARMPQKLRTMKLLIESGVDADSISGIEELWIWNARRMATTIAAAELAFMEYLKLAAAERVLIEALDAA